MTDTSSTCHFSNLVRQDLLQLNEKLYQQADFANDLLLQCGVDSSYALTQVGQRIEFGGENVRSHQDNAVLLIKGEKFHHDDLFWNDRQGQIWRW